MSLPIGAGAPPFDLPGVDGRNHALSDYSESPALAVVWSCNHCPYVQAWEGRMRQIQADYANRGFRLVAISSNDARSYPEDSFDGMRARARQQDFNFDYLYDADQSVARAYGAERTPEVFLFDGDRRLVYHGAIDDSRDEDQVSSDYLRDAVDAVLAGRQPDTTDTPAVGCTVKWLN